MQYTISPISQRTKPRHDPCVATEHGSFVISMFSSQVFDCSILRVALVTDKLYMFLALTEVVCLQPGLFNKTRNSLRALCLLRFHVSWF